MSDARLLCGIDRLEKEFSDLVGDRRLAMVSAASQISGTGEPVVDAVSRIAGKQLAAVWALQHGFFADRQDNMILSESFTHPHLGIPVRSLYGETLVPREEWLRGVDLLLVDVFDIGTRVYTFLNHMVLAMRHLSGGNITVVVLDRPNPLGGRETEGPPAHPGWFSMVAQLPVPMRHGLTAGEFLTWAADYHRIDLEIEVLEVRGWRRARGFSGTWTYPSPNMPTADTARLYPGAVMLEGTNLSEGRGTTRPFELVGAPWLDARSLAGELRALGYDGLDFLALGFRPEFGKFAREFCNGLLVLPRAGWDGRSFGLYYDLIRLARRRHAGEFAWAPPPYEFESERPPMDMICGGTKIREWIEADRPFAEVEPEINAALDAFRETAAPYLLYE